MEKYHDLKPKDSKDRFDEFFVKYRIGAKTDGIVVLAKNARDAVEKAGELLKAEFELVDLRRI